MIGKTVFIGCAGQRVTITEVIELRSLKQRKKSLLIILVHFQCLIVLSQNVKIQRALNVLIFASLPSFQVTF